MQPLPSAATNPGLAVGVCCGVAGLVVRGSGAAVLWFVVGYFLGKSLQSVFWAVRGGPTASGEKQT